MVGAVHTETRIEESSVSLGEGETGPRAVTLTVSNDAETEQTYTVGVRHGIATSHPTFNPGFYDAEGTAELGADTVTVPAGGSTELTVTLGEDFGEDGIIYGGWITLTGAEDDLVVPFAGLSGDYQALPVLDDQGMGLPVLGISDGAGSVLLDPDGDHTYTMQDGDIPYIAYYFGYPVERLEIQAYRVTRGGKTKPVNPAASLIDAADHLGRSAAPEVYGWDGSYPRQGTKPRTVKNGDYLLEMRVLKPLGDPEDPDHWETFTSPRFTIDDPDPRSGATR
ncbi:MAG: Fn3-like domain-containing protein [Brachybacterium sp.]|nr:Fn3-like domain-containing protein [Brachybacterium sp.]